MEGIYGFRGGKARENGGIRGKVRGFIWLMRWGGFDKKSSVFSVYVGRQTILGTDNFGNDYWSPLSKEQRGNTLKAIKGLPQCMWPRLIPIIKEDLRLG